MAPRRSAAFAAVASMLSALTAVLTYFPGLALPSPTGGYTHIGDTVIYLAALLFGPAMGATVGLVGPVIADLLIGYPRWYVTLVAHGLQGYVAGLGEGKRFPVQLAAMLVGGLIMSFTYFAVNVFVKGLAPALVSLARDIFGQTAVSVALAAILLKPLEKSPPVRAAQALLATGGQGSSAGRA
ncbi:MAG: ECF transporter S component [Thermofilaceae archaeon]